MKFSIESHIYWLPQVDKNRCFQECAHKLQWFVCNWIRLSPFMTISIVCFILILISKHEQHKEESSNFHFIDACEWYYDWNQLTKSRIEQWRFNSSEEEFFLLPYVKQCRQTPISMREVYVIHTREHYGLWLWEP